MRHVRIVVDSISTLTAQRMAYLVQLRADHDWLSRLWLAPSCFCWNANDFDLRKQKGRQLGTQTRSGNAFHIASPSAKETSYIDPISEPATPIPAIAIVVFIIRLLLYGGRIAQVLDQRASQLKYADTRATYDHKSAQK